MPKAPRDPVTAYARDVVDGRIVAGRLVRLACQRHLSDLRDGPARGLRWDLGAALAAIDFFREVLRLNGGAFEGQPFNPQPYQQFILGSVYGWKLPDGTRRFRTVYCEMGKGNGKALAIDTPIPTPDGWKTMGEIAPGDQVFDEAGNVTVVTAVSEVMHRRPCYRIGFDDGSSIVADAEHLWWTEMRRTGLTRKGEAIRGVPLKDRGAWRKGVRTTEEIVATLRYNNGKHQSANHSVPLCGGLKLPDTALPIEPYTLGVWLGDGDSDCSRVTIGDQDVELIGHLEAAGITVGERKQGKRHRVGGIGKRGPAGAASLNARLRAVGLLHNKHVPACYLRASASQRLALLQGLMDTDGHIAESGECEFCNTNLRLASAAKEIVESLGVKATLTIGRATLRGVDVGPKYRVLFFPPHDLSVFRLSRKAARQRRRHSRRRLAADRRIVACEPVASVPVKCIAVDSPSRLYLAGRAMIPTHNSPLAGGVGLYMLVADGEPRAEVYAAATKKDQAQILFRDAVAMVKQSPALSAHVTPTGAPLREWNLAYLRNGSFFRPIASDDGQSGPRPHCALIDEIHEHKTPHVVDMVRAGIKNRRQPLIFEITNSGHDRTSVCWQHHEYSAKVVAGILEDDTWFAYVCGLDLCDRCEEEGKAAPDDSCPDCDHWTDEATWPKANPGLDTVLPRDYLRQQVREAQGMPAKEATVKRLNFCVWTEAAVHAIPMNKWDACRRKIDPAELEGRDCFAGLDIGATSDFTAFVLLFPHDDVEWIDVPVDYDDDDAGARRVPRRSYTLLPFFWLPEHPRKRDVKMMESIALWRRRGLIRTTPGEVVDYDLVLEDIVKLADQYGMQRIAFDRGFQGAQMGTNLLNHFGDEVVCAFPQGIVSMNAPFREFVELVIQGRMHHDGHPVLRWMVSNVAAEVRGGLMKPSKDHSSEKIDVVTAATMALGVAMTHEDAAGWYRPGGLLA